MDNKLTISHNTSPRILDKFFIPLGTSRSKPSKKSSRRPHRSKSVVQTEDFVELPQRNETLGNLSITKEPRNFGPSIFSTLLHMFRLSRTTRGKNGDGHKSARGAQVKKKENFENGAAALEEESSTSSHSQSPSKENPQNGKPQLGAIQVEKGSLSPWRLSVASKFLGLPKYYSSSHKNQKLKNKYQREAEEKLEGLKGEHERELEFFSQLRKTDDHQPTRSNLNPSSLLGHSKDSNAYGSSLRDCLEVCAQTVTTEKRRWSFAVKHENALNGLKDHTRFCRKPLTSLTSPPRAAAAATPASCSSHYCSTLQSTTTTSGESTPMGASLGNCCAGRDVTLRINYLSTFTFSSKAYFFCDLLRTLQSGVTGMTRCGGICRGNVCVSIM